MIVTTYTCDKCKHSQSDKEKPMQLWEIGIGISPMEKNRYAYSRELSHKKLWCRDCVVKAGILPPNKDEKEKASEPPITLEDIIREIIQEELEASQG